MCVVRLTSLSELADLGPSWNGLAGGVPFRRLEWLAGWWRHYRTAQDELLTLIVCDSDRVVGIAPWYRTSSRAGGRVIQFLGGGEVCSDYVSVLCAPWLQRSVAEQLAAWLADDAADQWDLLELSGTPRSDELVSSLTGLLANRGHIVSESSEPNCWSVELPGTWDEHLAKLSKSRRERIRKLYRQEFLTSRAVLHAVERQEQLPRALDILVDLHQRRRQSLGEPGRFSSETFYSFHREMLEQLFNAGQLRLLWLELDGQPAAVEYSLVGSDTVYYYQGGFDPELADRRPGWLLFTGSLKRAIEEGYRRFDFLRGDEPYKASWGARPQPLVEWRVVGQHPLARARHVAWQAQQTMKRMARQGWSVATGMSGRTISTVED